MNLNIGEQVAELPYTYRYFRELSPSFLSLALLNRGVVFNLDRPLRYLELGFGQGVSLNVHAAAWDGEFWGNDFNAAHVAHARDLADASGARVRLSGETFAELAARDDLPQFDIIVLHGIWTWVSENDRAAIVDLANRTLAPGGLLYVSYNCITGWAGALGLRELLALYAAQESLAQTPVISRVDQALGFAQELVRAGAGYFKNHPHVVTQLQGMQGKDRAYVAHELFGANWHLSSHAQVSSQLGAIGLTFGASAMLLTHDGDERFGPEAAALLSRLGNPTVREAVRDAFANAQFREDIFIRGEPILASAEDRLRILADWRFVLTAPFGSMPPAVAWFGGEIQLETDENIQILRVLRAGGHAPKSLTEIAAAVGRQSDEVLKNLIVLTGVGFVQPAMGRRDAAALSRCASLNSHLCARAPRDGSVDALASPVLGAGVHVSRLQQLLLLANNRGIRTPRDQAEFAWQCLSQNDERGWARGRSQAETLAEFSKMAREFEVGMLPILKAVGVA